MIEQLTGFAPSVLAFRFVGKITRADYEQVLVPAIRASIERGGDIGVYCELGEGFEGYDASGLWADVKTGFKYYFSHMSAWKKIALVTDLEWIAHFVALFGWMTTCELELFSVAERQAAQHWIETGAE